MKMYIVTVGRILYTAQMFQRYPTDSVGKPNIWQMKKKERKTFRRKQNETFDLIHSLKQIYETIRRLVIQCTWCIFHPGASLCT